MTKLANNLADAWRVRADREATISELRGLALTTPEEYERSMADFRRAAAWYRYWSGIGAA